MAARGFTGEAYRGQGRFYEDSARRVCNLEPVRLSRLRIG
ncbi:hypothetical protein PD5205_00541 [Xanthomonas fragariae]|uniref:Uncharacterized protein n=1 Tax=Xanthomonas fragariae TaxID=48664 RepID=A0A1Y6GZR0_9XANT|nr:hypothetical protein NBC2815_03475 [Xanthomonas fragariae]SMR00690.1 hypothetical protein PD885_03469 [Xanthomonas fragariae]SMR01861.1 hypothetical protein PD5205_00541 [Xanthomonas fragariae]